MNPNTVEGGGSIDHSERGTMPDNNQPNSIETEIRDLKTQIRDLQETLSQHSSEIKRLNGLVSLLLEDDGRDYSPSQDWGDTD